MSTRKDRPCWNCGAKQKPYAPWLSPQSGEKWNPQCWASKWWKGEPTQVPCTRVAEDSKVEGTLGLCVEHLAEILALRGQPIASSH